VSERPAIILFDGHCNLCNASVQFVIRRDRRGRFKFAALQSEAGRALLKKAGGGEVTLDSVLLIADGKVYQRSAAALRIARRLDGCWPALFVFIIIPPPLRDCIYTWIARNRYRWFGRREECMVPTEELKGRFIG
jgi:predicted DCC family thiol-disulfide oxidoreductase YuxK